MDTAVDDVTGKNLVAAPRESLSNAFRHTGASRIEVVPEGGRRSGLLELRRRAESLGGDCRIDPGLGADGAGTSGCGSRPSNDASTE